MAISNNGGWEAGPRKRAPGEDFRFAVKFFGSVGLVITAIWLLNRFVG